MSVICYEWILFVQVCDIVRLIVTELREYLQFPYPNYKQGSVRILYDGHMITEAEVAQIS